MNKNDKILARLAGREPEYHCNHCESSWFKEEVDIESGIGLLKICPNCGLACAANEELEQIRNSGYYFH